MLLDKNKDFITLSRYGINVIALGSTHKRKIYDSNGKHKMIHSLQSCSFLKADPLNHIKFEFQDPNNRIISIEQ